MSYQRSESFDTADTNLSFQPNDKTNDYCNSGNQPEFVYLQKWLNYRQFEGCEVRQKNLYLNEYCALIQTFQKNRCISDEILLQNIATTFTGHALIWWSNNIDQITSLAKFERKLRRRFGRESENSILKVILKRKQRNEEPLLDYIDDMLNLMRRAQQNYSEIDQIKKITSGTLIKYQKYLEISISNGSNTIQEFTDKAADYVEYLAKRENKKTGCTHDEYSEDESE